MVVAPHPDDETLGAGGTIARMASVGSKVTVVTVSEHAPPLVTDAARERTRRELERATRMLGVQRSVHLGYEALLLSTGRGWELANQIHDIIDDAEPDVVLVPFVDRNADHRFVFESCMVATRPVASTRRIDVLAAYETPSATTWNAAHIEAAFRPTVYVDISMTIAAKLDALACYESQTQAAPGARSREAVCALAVLRGSEAAMHHAEAFQVIRSCW